MQKRNNFDHFCGSIQEGPPRHVSWFIIIQTIGFAVYPKLDGFIHQPMSFQIIAAMVNIKNA